MPHPHHPTSAWAVRILLTLCMFIIAASPDDEIARLIEQLGNRNWKSREEAAAELLEMGNRVLEPLREALDHPDAEIRLSAEKLIRKLSWRFTGELGEKVKDLFENYESLDVDERGFVVGQVTSRLGAEGIDILLHIAREDEEAQVRAMALRSASQLGGEELQETILEVLGGEEEFWAFRWIAFLRKERGEADLSLEASRKAIDRNAHDQDLNALYIQHLMDKELWDEATGSLEKMTEADPKNPLYRVLLVQTYERTGREEAATRELEEAFEMDPEDVGAYRLLIRECIRLEKFEIANRFIKKSKALHPGDLPIQGLRAQILEAQKKWDQAFRVYRFLYQTGDSGTADGKTWKEKIIEIMERRGEGDLVTDRLLGQMREAAIPVGLWRELGEIFRAKGLPDLAAIEYRRVLVFKRKDLDLLIELAEVHHERGDRDGAAGAATSALQFEDILPAPRSRLEAIRDRKAPGVPPPAMAPVIWTWSALEDEAWQRTPDRDDFPWQIPPISAGDTVVSAVYGTDSVVGLDRSTGRLKWRLDPPEPPAVPGSRVALLDLTWIAEAEDRVYLLYNIWHSLPGKFRVSKRKAGLLGIAADPEAGEIVARFELDASIDSSPGNTGPGGRLAYLHGRGLSGGGNVVLLDLPKGRVAWNRRFRRLGEHSPQILGDRTWVTLRPGLVGGLDLETGKEAETRHLSAGMTTAPAFGDDGIFVATSKGRLLGFRAAQREATWEAELSGIVSGLARTPGGRLLAAHRNGEISCWDSSKGERLWKTAPGRAVERSFSATAAMIFSLNGGTNSYWDEQGELIAIEPGQGEIRWRYPCQLGANLILAEDRAILAEGQIRKKFRLTAFSTSRDPAGPEIIARALRLEARSLASESRRSVAIAVLQRAIEIHDQADHYAVLTRVYMAQEDYKTARKMLIQGAEMDDSDWEVFGELLEELDEREAEKKAAQKRREEEEERRQEEQKRQQEGAEERDDPEEGDKGGEQEEEQAPGPEAPPTGVFGVLGR